MTQATSAGDQVLDRARFEGLSPRQQLDFYNENGFLLIPEAVSAGQMQRIDTELSAREIPRRWDYWDEWPGPELESLIANPRLLEPLHLCYGDDLRFFKSVYTEWRDRVATELENRRQRLHRDYTPEATDGDYRNSCASWVNVGHYFIDLDVDEGPLWVVPGSHRLAWTGQREFEEFGDQARMGLARAGDAVMFHWLTLHAGGAMASGNPRPSVFQSYRVGWAAPLDTVPEWPEEIVRQAPPELQKLLEGLNDGTRFGVHGMSRA